MTLGEKLQKLRAGRGLSQDALAEALEVSRQAVSKWERDEAMPETEKVVRISEFFQVSTDYLLKDTWDTLPAEEKAKPWDLSAWFREQGYLLGWIPLAYGVVRGVASAPALLMMDGGWYVTVMMLLSVIFWPVVCCLVIGVLIVWQGRCLAGRLSWRHVGWLPLLWGTLGLVRLAVWELLVRMAPENIGFASPGSEAWERYGVILPVYVGLVGIGAGMLWLKQRSKS